MAVKFGRVALPIEFESLSVENQRKIAISLAGEHYQQFCGKLPYVALIEGYKLCKNEKVVLVINVVDFA